LKWSALADGAFGRAAVPSGASTGEREALELRDGDKSRYSGKGVRKAVANVGGEIAKRVGGQDAESAHAGRAMISSTDADQEWLGANAILGVSMAALRASRVEDPLPATLAPCGNERAPFPSDDEHPERRRARGSSVDFRSSWSCR
jgi:enolase